MGMEMGKRQIEPMQMFSVLSNRKLYWAKLAI